MVQTRLKEFEPTHKNRAKKATARADELDRVLASVLAHSQHLEAELAQLRSMRGNTREETESPTHVYGHGRPERLASRSRANSINAKACSSSASESRLMYRMRYISETQVQL